MSAELDRLREQHARLQERLTTVDDPGLRVEEMRQRLGALRESVSSPSGNVTVVAGPGGSIQDIVLADGAVRQPASALAAELKTAVQQAVATAARQQARIVDEHTGSQLGTYDRVLQNQADAFGTTVDELKQSFEDARRPKPQRAKRDDDDFSQNSLMKKDHAR